MKNFKTLFLIGLVSILMLSICGCSKEDKHTGIIGTWESTNIFQHYELAGDKVSEINTDVKPGDDECVRYEFFEGEDVYRYNYRQGEWSVGSKSSYEYSGNTLKIDELSGLGDLTVTSLTSNQLVFESTIKEQGITGYERRTFKRVD